MQPAMLAAAAAFSAATLAVTWALSRSMRRLDAATRRAVIAERSLQESKAHADTLQSSLDAVKQEASDLAHRLSPLLNVEEEAAKAKAAANQSIGALNAQVDALRAKYTTGHQRYEELSAVVRSLEEDLEAIDVGLYKPHFTYTDSESFKQALTEVRHEQAQMVKDGRAAVCDAKWVVNESSKEGERWVKQLQKLFLRAFSAESDTAIANVSWNNWSVMENRINKSFDILNRLGTAMHVTISEEYRDARLRELRLVFEEAELRRNEREDQRRVRAEQREEERVQRELEREREDAAKDQARYERALAKAQADLTAAQESEREAMQERIKKLEAELADATSRQERALAQAQLTKVGHVYIISNVGSFGTDVMKIGLTRRLEPEERVRELGDASVPFPFDIHALIYSDDAPALEAKLHEAFWDKRLNRANDRKEFFRVSLPELEQSLESLGLAPTLLEVPEAREYRETLVIQNRPALAKPASSAPATSFPVDPFADGPYTGDSQSRSGVDLSAP